MKTLDKRKLFSLSEGDRFYFLNDKRKLVYIFESKEDTADYEIPDWKIQHGHTTVKYRDYNKKYYTKTHNFDVVFIRNETA